MIWWTAKNNSSFLNGRRYAKTMKTAVRDARRYVLGELYGEGRISYYEEKDSEWPIREDEKSIFTNQRWKTRIVD